eukprot:TRINITY_DN0_c581_g1_i2.p1 TRINITY_DN0_c581_g1~~TRINITY_DN0_c581_g1_i2.p1  ORF type:complete len:325 (-),score=73.93 TRINITY_DN0_c581_g1_i2:98-1072(-)
MGVSCRFYVTACMTILVILFATTSAWRDYGHGVIAEIIKQELLERNPDIYAKVEKIAGFIGNITDGGNDAFHESFAWIDDMRDRMGITLWDKWHFINKPINDDGLMNLEDPEKGENLLWGLRLAQAALNKPAKNRRISDPTIERSMMMRIFLHLMGDIHQPLHTSNRYTIDKNQGDMGGNRFYIQYNGVVYDLHTFWDCGALTFPDYPRPWTAEALQSIIDTANIIKGRYPRSLLQPPKDDQYTNWIQNSYNLARNVVYGPLTNIAAPATITVEYYNTALDTVQKQLALAAYRAADILISIYENADESIAVDVKPARNCLRRRN